MTRGRSTALSLPFLLVAACFDPVCPGGTVLQGGRCYALDAGPCGGGCEEHAPICELDSNSCVECLADEHCAGDTPACETTTQTCVQCKVGNDEACVGATPFCDIHTNNCQVCLANEDCTSASAAQCDTSQPAHVCAGCDDDFHCEGVTDGERALPVCNDGTCVECTEDNASACEGNSCTADNVCSSD